MENEVITPDDIFKEIAKLYAMLGKKLFELQRLLVKEKRK